MCPAERRKKHQSRALCAFVFAVFSGLAGIGFTVIKSPQSRSDAYMALALESYEAQAYQAASVAAMEAVRLNPVSPEGWRLLSQALDQNGQSTASRKAAQIAARLQHNPNGPNPLYAMPAELKLSFLADAESGVR